MRRWSGSALVHIMACRLFGAKPLSKPVLEFPHLGTKEQTSVKFNQNIKISFTKMRLKITSAKSRPFCPAGDELTLVGYFRSRHLFALVLHSWGKCLWLYQDHITKYRNLSQFICCALLSAYDLTGALCMFFVTADYLTLEIAAMHT